MSKDSLNIHQQMMSLKNGEYFYSDRPPQAFTYISHHGIKIKTEIFISVNGRTLQAVKLTKVTRAN